jgi:hypothetical protein
MPDPLLPALPLQKDVIPPRVAREAANAEELRLLINAAYIAGLPPCQVRRLLHFNQITTGSSCYSHMHRHGSRLASP